MERYKLLDPKEEHDLACRARAGDAAARKRLIEAHLDVVKFAALALHQHDRIPIEDLVQEGVAGLIEAVDRFDPSRGFRLLTYAKYLIRGEMLRAVIAYGPAMSTGHTPTQYKLQFRLGHAAGENVEELAEEFGTPPIQIERALLTRRPALSLDAVDARTELALHEVIPDGQLLPDETYAQRERHERLQQALRTVERTEREDEILRGCIYGELSYEMVGRCLGITRQRVQQIWSHFLAKLRAAMESQEIQEVAAAA